jgi:hypothetical protein
MQSFLVVRLHMWRGTVLDATRLGTSSAVLQSKNQNIYRIQITQDQIEIKGIRPLDNLQGKFEAQGPCSLLLAY